MLTLLMAPTLLAVASAQVATDPRDVGVSWPWLLFGLAAQGLFAGRMVLQWLASERAGRSTVPTGFWWMSVVGGLALGVYFLRRGDPVGLIGQMSGVFIYGRNLWLIHRSNP